jgi:hypothetical protein
MLRIRTHTKLFSKEYFSDGGREGKGGWQGLAIGSGSRKGSNSPFCLKQFLLCPLNHSTFDMYAL